ncbi:MAG TPA: hypothetical protein VGQ32_07790 [Thermoanaerobaculia bacterium]|nr:hypothetical protein [Thermoanaerobaculia bacterium]
MPQPGRRALAPWMLLFFSWPLAAADDVKIAAGTVEEERYSDSKFGGLTVELQLTGDAVKDVKALRTKVKSARDDRGTSLYKPSKEDRPSDFQEFSVSTRPGPRFQLSMPPREASTIDVSGEVELFIPSRDPDTKMTVEGFLNRLDKPIATPALKAAKAEITPLSAAAYKARQAGNKPKKEDIIAEGKKHGASEEEIKQALAMIEAFASLGGEEPTENSVLLETKDPDGRIISIDVVGADGKDLHSGSRGSQGGRESKLMKIDLSSKPPADAALLVTLRTPKSVVTVPVNLKGVALP